MDVEPKLGGRVTRHNCPSGSDAEAKHPVKVSNCLVKREGRMYRRGGRRTGEDVKVSDVFQESGG